MRARRSWHALASNVSPTLRAACPACGLCRYTGCGHGCACACLPARARVFCVCAYVCVCPRARVRAHAHACVQKHVLNLGSHGVRWTAGETETGSEVWTTSGGGMGRMERWSAGTETGTGSGMRAGGCGTRTTCCTHGRGAVIHSTQLQSAAVPCAFRAHAELGGSYLHIRHAHAFKCSHHAQR